MYSTGRKKPNRERVLERLGNAKRNLKGMLRERNGNTKRMLETKRSISRFLRARSQAHKIQWNAAKDDA